MDISFHCSYSLKRHSCVKHPLLSKFKMDFESDLKRNYEEIGVIGKGSFGEAIRFVSKDYQSELVLKTGDDACLREEIMVYRLLQNCEGIPKIYGWGSWKSRLALAMENVGPNLESYACRRMATFSPTTAALVGIELVLSIN